MQVSTYTMLASIQNAGFMAPVYTKLYSINGGIPLFRPSETVLDILAVPQKGPFAKEDGEPLIDAEGRRVQK
jgi:hypothetical protein